MTDTVTIDHDPNEGQQVEQPTQAPPQQADIDNGDDGRRLAIREARSMIPVGPTGAQPMDLTQQIDFAGTMAKAMFGIPAHLRKNVGDCLAVLDIASRAGLSPYMVAGKTYVQNDRLCFESQLFHALLVKSNLLIGDLEVSYAGEGDARTCTITGILRSDRKPRTYTTPPLGVIRPKRNDKGTVKGSPLWDKKPDVQQFYDGSRDWTRMFAPTATLGIYTPEEMQETPINEAEPSGEALKMRLAGADRSEGHSPDKVKTDLEQLGNTKQRVILPAQATRKPRQPRADTKAATQEPAAAPPASGRRKRLAERAAARAAQQPAAEVLPKSTHTETLVNPKSEPKPAEVKAIADRAEGKKEPEPATKPPATAEEYKDYAVAWIEAATNGDTAMARWDDERDMRDALAVEIPARNSLRARLIGKFPDFEQ